MNAVKKPAHAAGLLLVGVATTLFAAAGHAEGRSAANPRFLSECGSCHVPYPARFLSAPAWRTIMDGLNEHFGVDASLDATTAAEIRGYLEFNAASPRKIAGDPSLVRITESPRFVRKHDEIPPTALRSAGVTSMVDCAACHAHAQDGRFGHDARVPR